jgi:hypothetical protein
VQIAKNAENGGGDNTIHCRAGQMYTRERLIEDGEGNEGLEKNSNVIRPASIIDYVHIAQPFLETTAKYGLSGRAKLPWVVSSVSMAE